MALDELKDATQCSTARTTTYSEISVVIVCVIELINTCLD
jgi:hypothetical protein